jgi:hypothetical protein
VSGEVNHAPDIQEKLSRFYVDKLLDAVIDDNVRVQEERKFCAHCSCLQVGNVTSITRLRVFKNIPKPTHWASMPKGTVLKGMVVHTCLRCGERFMEPGKMGKRVLIHKKEDEVQLRQVKKRKKKAQKLSASLKATSTKQAVQPQKGHSLQDFLKGL